VYYAVVTSWQTEDNPETYRITFPERDGLDKWLTEVKEHAGQMGGKERPVTITYYGSSLPSPEHVTFNMSDVVYIYILNAAENQEWLDRRLGRRAKFTQPLLTRGEIQQGRRARAGSMLG